jgi:hypothetical protein
MARPTTSKLRTGRLASAFTDTDIVPVCRDANRLKAHLDALLQLF